MSRFLFLLSLMATIIIISVEGGWRSKKKYYKKSSSSKYYSSSSSSKYSSSSSKGGWWGKPSPTPKPTPATPKPSPYPTEECELTGVWLNRDTPEITGDWELAWKFRYEGTQVCPNGGTPQDALCREVDTEVDFDDYNWGHYRYLLCDYRGFLCVDYDSSYYDECPDFEVQFCCPPGH